MPVPDRLSDVTPNQLIDLRSLDFGRWLSCLHETGAPIAASERFLERFPRSLSAGVVTQSIDLMTKAAVAAGSTTVPAWAGALAAPAPLLDAFLALARSASLIGRINGLIKAPFGVKVPIETQGANYYWTAQGQPKPIARFTFDPGVTLTPTKCAGVVAVTEELIALVDPAMAAMLRRVLLDGLTAFTDTSFLAPTSTLIADTRPASITAGLTPVASVAGNLRASVDALLAAFFAARPGADNAVLVMTAGARAALIGPAGGTTYGGVPVTTTGAAVGLAVVLDPLGIAVADGGVTIDTSAHAAVLLDDAPDATAAGVVTSFWQQSLVGVKTERVLNWVAAPTAVAYTALTP